MKRPIATSIIILLAFSLNVLAQSKTIDIWQGDVPGAIDKPDYHLIADSSGSWTYMRRITNPKLDVYPAPENIANGMAVIICPGGGYWALAYKHEGSAIARWLNNQGITAFVLKYRLPDDAIMKDKSIGPMQDGQEAIRIVRRNATSWNINPDRIGILGFSAGGHLASTLSTHFDEKVYEAKDKTSARPDFSILIYPVISMDTTITHLGSRDNLLGKNPSNDVVKHFSNELQVNEKTPPAFLVHSLDDGAVPAENSINYALAMKKFEIPCELHLYQSGGHGYGLGKSENGTELSWPAACELWLKRIAKINNR
jgi:acetyl esterase/lipase